MTSNLESEHLQPEAWIKEVEAMKAEIRAYYAPLIAAEEATKAKMTPAQLEVEGPEIDAKIERLRGSERIYFSKLSRKFVHIRAGWSFTGVRNGLHLTQSSCGIWLRSKRDTRNVSRS